VKTGIQENQSRRGGRLPLPDQVEDKLRWSYGLGDFLRDHQFLYHKKKGSETSLFIHYPIPNTQYPAYHFDRYQEKPD